RTRRRSSPADPFASTLDVLELYARASSEDRRESQTGRRTTLSIGLPQQGVRRRRGEEGEDNEFDSKNFVCRCGHLSDTGGGCSVASRRPCRRLCSRETKSR